MIRARRDDPRRRSNERAQIGFVITAVHLVFEDRPRVFEPVEEVPDVGRREAMCSLGVLCANGQGVANYVKAREWLEKATDQRGIRGPTLC